MPISAGMKSVDIFVGDQHCAGAAERTLDNVARIRRDVEQFGDPHGEPARVSGAIVTFEPGARTAWHTHPLGQTLIVTSGLGWVQREGGPKEEIRPGDIVWFAPGEKHWHGRRCQRRRSPDMLQVPRTAARLRCSRCSFPTQPQRRELPLAGHHAPKPTGFARHVPAVRLDLSGTPLWRSPDRTISMLSGPW